jgi:leader peptidase (prepilin peptidase)/N-methyltransferase
VPGFIFSVFQSERQKILKTVFTVFSFLFGAAIGSFLNVLIYRIPLGKSIVKPRSFCPHCKKQIAWYENIPLVSYVLLRGKCSRCHSSISLHYPAVELITACLLTYLFIRYGINVSFLAYVVFFCSLIVISGIDFTHQVIPDMISIPGILIGLVFSLINGMFITGLVGMFFGGGLILLIRIIGGRVYKKEVMGLGDVYLTAMIGAFVGFPLIIIAIFIAALVGSILGILFIVSTGQSRESPIPFGPFLSIGGISIVVFRAQINAFFALLGITL